MHRQWIVRRANSCCVPIASASRKAGFQVDIVITTTAPDKEPEERAYRILSKGNSRTLVQTTAPVVERNQILLMRDRDLWAFMPNLSQPIRLPLSQRLTGQVANGDLARANFVGDYEPNILRKETLDGETYHVLQLDAVDRWVTYRKVLYWVSAKTDDRTNRSSTRCPDVCSKLPTTATSRISATRSAQPG
jgi:hypothetical protein